MPTLKPVSDPNILAQLNNMGGGKPMTQSQVADDVTAMRKEFAARQAVKDYETVLPLVASSMNVPDNPAGDLALIYNYGKVMDPGSVVREGEMAMVNSAAPLAEQFTGTLRKEFDSKGRFTPQRRKELVEIMRRRAGSYNEKYLAERRNFARLAKKRGFDPEDIIGQHAGATFRDEESRFLGRPVRDTDMQGRPLKPKGGGWSIERAD